MHLRNFLLFVFFLMTAAVLFPQQKTFTKDCTEKESVSLRRGETFLNNCDNAVVLNAVAVRETENTLEKYDSLNTLYADLRKTYHSIDSAQDSIVKKYEKVFAIQDSAYRSMVMLQKNTSSLVEAAVKNNERALTYARKIQAASYLSSGVVGGIAGGLIDGDGKFGWTGALIGAAGGILVNYLIQKLF